MNEEKKIRVISFTKQGEQAEPGDREKINGDRISLFLLYGGTLCR